MEGAARTLEGLIGEIQDIRHEVGLFKSQEICFEELSVRLEKEIAGRKLAEESNIHRSQFLADKAHAIRTPLSVIAGFLELLEDTRIDEEQKSYIELMQKASKSLSQIIDDVFDVSV